MLDAVDRSAASRPAQHAHPEAPRAPHHGAPDPAQADDAERGTVHVPSQQELRIPALDARPVSATHEAIGLGDAARRGEQQREGEVGRGLREHARGVTHREPSGRGRGDVHVVEAHRAGRHDAQVGTRVEQLRVDAVGEHAEKALRPSGVAAQGLGVRRAGPAEDLEAHGGTQARERAARQRARCEDPRLPRHQRVRLRLNRSAGQTRRSGGAMQPGARNPRQDRVLIPTL